MGHAFHRAQFGDQSKELEKQMKVATKKFLTSHVYRREISYLWPIGKKNNLLSIKIIETKCYDL